MARLRRWQHEPDDDQRARPANGLEDLQELHRRPLGGIEERANLHLDQPGPQGRGAGRDASLHWRGRERRHRGGPEGLSRLEAYPGANSRRDLSQGGADPPGAEGRAGPPDDAGDGQSPQGGAWRRPGGDRHGQVCRRSRTPPAWGNRTLGASQQVVHDRTSPAGRGRLHHPLELPDGHPVVEDLPGGDGGQRGRIQARL